ncbi:hypothetical protein PIIN_05375 [Serendipita indica DSM 11827]|uniref:DUF2306 domain-containing protein n=1 Tax=Serendipita indica (strain DSM 11827) TaxID=1109443 RepID=G4TJF2_SERID|nr:hypothetical protein PIIN_05375 [Serendipita indica DSM 11827]
MSEQGPHKVDATTTSASSEPTASSNILVRLWSSLSRRLGFRRPLSFFFFFILGGALMGFSLANFRSLAPHRYYNGAFAPGELYWFRGGSRKVGMLLHLGTILPCGVLSVLQFVPGIRKKYLLFHRINGYTVLTLILLGVIGGLMMSRHAFGGDVSSAGGIYALALVTLFSAGMGYYNIKRLQIEQHRKWMLRSVVYMSSIVTMRIIMIISALIVTAIGGFFMPWNCEELLYTFKGNTTQLAHAGYSQCTDGSTSRSVLVPANMKDDPQGVASALRSGFGNSAWAALLIHIFLLEVYLNLTPNETERLRAISYQKQLEAGARHPGSAGITSDRWGDAKPYRNTQTNA